MVIDMPDRPDFIKHVSEIEPYHYEQKNPPGGKGRSIGLSRATGGRKIGADILIIEPGDVLSHFHWHTKWEEFFYILKGECFLRVGDERYALREGDVVTCVPDMGQGHQFANDSDASVWILAIDSRDGDDEVYRPDLGTIWRRADRSERSLPEDTESGALNSTD